MKTNRIDITVAWGDCDPANIVFYPNFFRWFEIGTTELFASVGLDLPEMYKAEGILGIPILDAGASFKRPSRFRDVITVESGIEKWGNSSFRVAHKIFNSDEEAVTGHEVHGWVVVDESHASGIRAVPVPQPIRDAFL